MNRQAKKAVRALRDRWTRSATIMRSSVTTGLNALRTNQKGQGTTEYAILVGVLVVIAIIAVIAFRDNLQQLWERISEGINSL